MASTVEEATGKDVASLMITAIEKKLKWIREFPLD